MGLMVSSKFAEKLEILKVSVIPKVTQCGLDLWEGRSASAGTPLPSCRAIPECQEGDSTLGLTTGFFHENWEDPG